MRSVGDFTLVWGESLRWDDRRQRLYFVDCATRVLHWLDGGEPPLASMQMPSLPTGVVLTEGDELVVCLDDGLHVVDADAGSTRLLAAYPDGMHGRANDANADGRGHLVTGTLNMGPGPGSLWRYSSTDGWTHLADDTGNANGPVVTDLDGARTLVIGDTVARAVHAYPYDPDAGVGERRVLHDHATIGGAPDGAAADAEGAVWSCVLRTGAIVRLGPDGLRDRIDVPMANPSDIAFGGPDLDRLYVTSIALDLGEGRPVAEQAHHLNVLDAPVAGRPEARFRLG